MRLNVIFAVIPSFRDWEYLILRERHIVRLFLGRINIDDLL
jgi:hypothetical protein